MSFTSATFLIFLALALSLWPWLRAEPLRRWWGLTVLSFVFYGWWDWRFSALLLFSGLVDFYAALAMDRRPAWRRFLLGLSLLCNLGLLAFFKYTAFFARESSWLLGWPDPSLVSAAQSIILPVGISFYTFQSLSYTIDVYRGELRPTSSLGHFLAYLSLFPQLVAGPIVRAGDLLPQLETPGKADAADRLAAVELVALGFFKKCVIADNLAPAADRLFSVGALGAADGAAAWFAAALFAAQICCDFSGYSDIACGIARWMGYDFPVNFRRPYLALGLRDFWSRWHITLSTWFRDYVYRPLGGSRVSAPRTQLNLWITLLASGLWHGANLTFLAWGALHAALLSFERITRWPERLSGNLAGRAVGIAITFLLVIWGWVFFRAETLTQAWTLTRAMFGAPMGGLATIAAATTAPVAVALAACALLGLGAALPSEFLRRRAPLRAAVTVAALVGAVYLRGSGHAFIYFQF
jgi:alginate O-acetyltransferase complex protein AlgI